MEIEMEIIFLQKRKVRMEFNLKWNYNGIGYCLTRMDLEWEVEIILKWNLLQF